MIKAYDLHKYIPQSCRKLKCVSNTQQQYPSTIQYLPR